MWERPRTGEALKYLRTQWTQGMENREVEESKRADGRLDKEWRGGFGSAWFPKVAGKPGVVDL